MIKLGNDNFFFEIDDTFRESKLLIPIRMVINDSILGTLESPTYLPSFIGAIDSILESDHYLISNMTLDELKSIVKNNEENNRLDAYKVTLEETFDDFFKVFIRNRDSLLIHIMRYKNPFFSDTNIPSNSEVFESVPLVEFREAVNLLKNYVQIRGLGLRQ